MDTNQDKLRIANLGLSKISGKIITSFNQDTPSAIAVNLVYDQCRNECLEEADFSFARKIVALSEIDLEIPDFGDGVDIAYAYPNDFLKAWEFDIKAAITRFQSDGIYSDTADLLMRYTFLNDNPNTYSAKFCNALACKIAYELCFKINNAKDFAAAKYSEYIKAIESAIGADAQMGTPQNAIQDEWYLARIAGANTGVNLANGNVIFN